jgi:hypothetical protein
MDDSEYNDDRMYVLRLTQDFDVEKDGLVSAVAFGPAPARDKEKPTLLVTYRNTRSLPAIRTDTFPTLSEALDYVRKVEPTCPRVSLQGREPQPTLTWEEHLAWLHQNGLVSAADGPLRRMLL